jgi:cytochrome c
MNRFRLLLLILIGTAISYGFIINGNDNVSTITPIAEVNKLSVVEVEHAFGADLPNHYIKNYDEELAKVGEELIKVGKSSYKEHSGQRISPYFNCTDCHNLVKETEEITNLDPQDRLDYLVENELPFAAGSTFFGIYNRSKFYNDDYYKKYGDLVTDAKDTLENAVQLCAEYCASGRKLESWELKAIMHYFKKHELKISDLGLDGTEQELINTALSDEVNQSEALALIQTSYVDRYHATFTGAMPENERKYGENGDPENGEKIYKSACMFCHENSRVTYLDLNDDVLSGKYLWKHREGYDDLSVYQVLRWGTYPITGRKQYMPLYTKEKMSNNQLEDLMAYIKKLANK